MPKPNNSVRVQPIDRSTYRFTLNISDSTPDLAERKT